MKVNPKALKQEFNQLLEKHEEIERDRHIQAKKRKYEHLKLETQHNISSLSEIFQDPELLARISSDTYNILKEKITRPSRIRTGPDLVITKKPQAKDVMTSRVVDDEVLDLYKVVEGSIDNQEKQYVNPLAPKVRKYIVEESSESESTTAISSTSDGTPTTPVIVNAPHNELNLALPSQAVASTATTVEPKKDELTLMLEEASRVIQHSPLNTVNPLNLHSLLPRQADSKAYIYVKGNYTPTENSQKTTETLDHDTLVAVTLFDAQNSSIKFQQIEILGSQTLADLRDAIYCQSDFVRNRDRKNQQPDGEIVNTTKTKLSPSMIYMDHVFYVDTRYKHAEDTYSTLIDAWLTKNRVNREVFKFQQKEMQKTLWEDLNLGINMPFAFIHQEKCEHMFIIQDVRLIPSAEYETKEEFPRTTHNLRYDRFKCSMCAVFPATKITHDDILSGFSPCYFCDVCFKSFHHGDSNIKVTEYYGTPGGEPRIGKSSSRSH